MNYLKKQIEKKLSTSPYYATEQDCKNIITDFDHFPYTRWYRGNSALYVPVVAERQAGWRIRHDDCYKQEKTIDNTHTPNVCFQNAPNAAFPCQTSGQPNDKFYNKSCIVQNY
jgi:hypothetical protein